MSPARDRESPVVARIPARAALAGNPTDGYGGAVLAVPVGPLGATVRARWASEDGIVRLDDGGPTPDGVAALLIAAVGRFRAVHDRWCGPVELAWRTGIPRSVGLAGSSALVIATLVALEELDGVEVDPVDRAATALAVETDDLDIAAGPQDRVVQSLGVPVLMTFAEPGAHDMGTHRRVEGALLDELFVAWSTSGAAPSGVLHGDLRARWARADDALREAVDALAATAPAAAAALDAADRAAFDAAVNESLRRRVALVDVDPTTTALAALARHHGASANSAGSGGAVVGRCDPDGWEGLARAYREAGAGFVHLGSSPSDPEAP